MFGDQTVLFGLDNDVCLAWGARAIAHSDCIDLLGDRMQFLEKVEARWLTLDSSRREVYLLLMHRLQHATRKYRAKAGTLLKSGMMDPRRGEVFTLFEKDGLTVTGNTRGSHGYVYLTAWLKPETGRKPSGANPEG